MWGWKDNYLLIRERAELDMLGFKEKVSRKLVGPILDVLAIHIEDFQTRFGLV